MEVSLAHNQVEWDSWLDQQAGSFLQSWKWGEILAREGKIVERLQVVEGEVVVAQAQVVYTKFPLGIRYGFCVGGPVIKSEIRNPYLLTEGKQSETNSNDQIFKPLINYLAQKRYIFFRFESSFDLSPLTFHLRKSLDITPPATVILDLTKTDEELLVAMHEKTRYNIRLAQKKDLKIERLKDFECFWKLSEATAKRDGFRLHPKEHYKNVLNSPLTHQITLYSGEVPVASAIFVGFGNTFTYLFGASDHEFRNLMAPHLLQWEGTKLGRSLGYKQYDFFGIAPRLESRVKNQESRVDEYQYDPNHQYAGVTRFKIGFGGAISEAPGTHDLIISPMRYRIYEALRWIRRLI